MQLYNRILLVGLTVLVIMSMLGTAAAQDEYDEGYWAGFGALFFGVLCFLWVFMFIIWIVIGVWLYRDAEKRGKSGALWLILGLLFGIIALIIWLIVRPPVKGHQEEKMRRSCPECGREIPEDANVCPYCGKKFGLI